MSSLTQHNCWGHSLGYTHEICSSCMWRKDTHNHCNKSKQFTLCCVNGHDKGGVTLSYISTTFVEGWDWQQVCVSELLLGPVWPNNNNSDMQWISADKQHCSGHTAIILRTSTHWNAINQASSEDGSVPSHQAAVWHAIAFFWSTQHKPELW